MKIPVRIPRRLYKYRRFDAMALRLLSQGEVYYSDPRQFNDPMDCDPSIEIDVELDTLEKVCYQFLLGSQSKEQAIKRMNHHRYMSTECGDFRKDQEAHDRLKWDLAVEIKRLLEAEMARIGVFCLAGKWDSVLMWSHYADEHRGVCIE